MRAPLVAVILGCMIMPSMGAEALVLKRGIGIHEWLNWAPVDESGLHYQKPLYQTVEQWQTRYRDLADWPAGNEFARIRDMGFDFVRLTVDPGPLLDNDGRDRAEGLAVLEAAVSEVTGQGLKVVFDFHLVPQVEAFGQEAMESEVGSPQLEAFRELLGETAAMLVRVGIDSVAFEPMNEPQYYPCDGWAGEEWQKVMASFVSTIRAVSTDLTIVATGACGGGPYGLIQLDARQFDDPAILYSFHTYEPHEFTHQGTGDKLHLAGLPWPASERSRAEVEATSREAMTADGMDDTEQDAVLAALDGMISQYYAEGWGSERLEQGLDEVLAWAGEQGVAPERLFVGEFGVTRFRPESGGALDVDRFRYLRAVRTLAEAHGMAWSMWEYSNPHGMSLIQPEGPAVAEPGTLEALGLVTP